MILKVEMLSIQINTMAILLSEFNVSPIYRADLRGSRTLSFGNMSVVSLHSYAVKFDEQ